MRTDKKNQYRLMAAIIAVVLIVDQVIKICVKTSMQIGEEIPLIGNWCLLHFVENEGMAFGMAYGGAAGKLILSLFRLVASSFIFYYLLRLIKKGIRNSVVISLSLIFVGAVGNLVDSCFYGLIFDESYYHVAQLFPPEGGYAGFLFGRVVDMFYFPIIDTVLPSWVPFFGNERFVFFNAIFNFADASITIGVILLIIDQLFISKKCCKSADIEKS
ncbi:MAG: lipoprotein signal peptidase [Bacteroidales bacterium]|nr:lipoprotein signal peptidase [Candidatus Colimorpha onthohippi]